MSELLGSPAVRQIVSRLNKGDNDEQSLIEKIESSCKKFDHSGKGYLSPGFSIITQICNGLNFYRIIAFIYR